MLPHCPGPCRRPPLNRTYSNYCFALIKLKDKNLPPLGNDVQNPLRPGCPSGLMSGDPCTCKRVSPDELERAVPWNEFVALIAPQAQNKKAAGPRGCPDKTHSWNNDVRG
jgi:hypothetical protein